MIRSAGQTVSDLGFTISNAPGMLSEPRPPSGRLANISCTGSVTNVSGDPGAVAGARPPPPNGTGFFSISGNTITLEAIGGGQPSQLLLPSSSSFPNANASITHGQFNPLHRRAHDLYFHVSQGSRPIRQSLARRFPSGQDLIRLLPAFLPAFLSKLSPVPLSALACRGCC